ncbi:CPBP family intramembrane glutamic endopeptidase [Staphylococcus lutrae]|uniref:CAAX prenyl protease 2/Lysostaphin resistance protein A-like domain-containing protein n=1 Tax=Staphylococcus lutrae TaxID=155085 RepID=A0AAC9RVD9_9STAP|nr:CPBP family intramembrane glutamic endopeptidase [Staphylococcus lutrae]ARJ51770.1 hypothetical protein B5P37_10810 [Staphylococcus lutrae]PNZ34421.1 CPBP family intramembrane metalloprotease [Staphylococcus lutrae]
MNTLKLLFKDDLSVSKAPYIETLIKGTIIGFILYMALEISNFVTKSAWYGLLSLLVIIFGIWLCQKLGLTFFKSRKYTVKDFLFVFGGYILLKVLDLLFAMFLSSAVPVNDQNIKDAFTGTPTWLLVISLAIVPALVEELLFRGLILRVLFRNHLFIGLIVSSILFASLHASENFIGYLPYFYFGMILGLVYLKTRKIELAIAIHLLNNGLIALFLYM